jgi:hypothetical protein
MSLKEFRRFVRATGRIPVAAVRRKVISNAKTLIRSHESRDASEEDKKAFREGTEAAIALLESLSPAQMSSVFCHERWGQAVGKKQ